MGRSVMWSDPDLLFTCNKKGPDGEAMTSTLTWDFAEMIPKY